MKASRLLLVAALLAASVTAFASPASAQIRRRGGRDAIWRSSEGRYRRPMRAGFPERRGGFMFCRLWYDAVRRLPSGLGWSTDYPASGHNFMTRLEELTTTPIDRWSDGEVGSTAVRATDPDLFLCPFVVMSDPGSAGLSDEEVAKLREYLLKGGFLWCEDMWTDRAWAYVEQDIHRILPGYPIVDLKPDNPLFSFQYVLEKIPQIPSLQSWERSGGRPDEFGPSNKAQLHAVFDEKGHLMVLVSHNTDIGDGWERETAAPEFFYTFSPLAYGLGINVALWVMTH